ncbi:MAG: type II secretion system secretin GspD [Pseudomonadota bacterium]|nr:type II secretion system secretin GspD [Pseudomonadota bacterium]
MQQPLKTVSSTFAQPSPWRKLYLLTPLLVALALPVHAQTWKINLRDADIAAFIGEVADITGKNFVVDPRVKGNITVISNKALSKTEVYDLFMGVMNVNGVVAVPSGNTVKLVPDVNAKQAGVPFDLRRRAGEEEVVTRIIWLENTNPNDLIPAIRPLMPQFAHLAAVPGTNALLVSDRAGNINQLENLVQSLDGGENDRLDIIPLQHSQADEIIELVEAMSGNAPARDVRGSRLRIIADSRSNRLLVKGDARSRERIRALVQQLDVVPSERLGGLRVFRLNHASAKNLAEMLQGLMDNSSLVSSAPTSSLSTSGMGLGSEGASGSGTASNTSSTTSNVGSRSSSSSVSGSTAKRGSGVSIIADESQNALVVKADPALMREIESAIKQLDVRRAQVLIQAAIVEVSGSNVDQLGVQWALGNANTGVGAISFDNAGVSLGNLAAAVATNNPALAASVSGALIGLGERRADNSFYGAILQALQSTTNTNLLSVPSVMTLDNEEANILIGQNVPFITGSTTTGAGGTTNPFTTIERQDVGINLKVIPHVGDSGTIRLEVAQEVSSIETTNAVRSSDLITNKRFIKTTVLADNQQTIVLGGLMQEDQSKLLSQVPGLGRIPVIGALFRSRADEQKKRNLLVFLQPTILRDNSASGQLAQNRYNQIRMLQLELDPKGDFNRLPEQVSRVYTPEPTVPNTIPKAEQ